METITTLINASTTLYILTKIIEVIFIWLFLSSAIKHGTKKAIIEATEEINQNKINPPKTPEEALKEEMEGWN